MAVLGLHSWESLKIRDGLKRQDIDNRKGHNFDHVDQANHSFTLESDTIWKPIKQEWFILSYPISIAVFVLFFTIFCMYWLYWLHNYKKIVSNAATVLHVNDYFARQWLFPTVVTISHGSDCFTCGGKCFVHLFCTRRWLFSSGNLVPCSYCWWKYG